MAQHAHQGSDSDPARDEKQMRFLGVKPVGKSSEGPVEREEIIFGDVRNTAGEITGLLNGGRDAFSVRRAGRYGERVLLCRDSRSGAEWREEMELSGEEVLGSAPVGRFQRNGVDFIRFRNDGYHAERPFLELPGSEDLVPDICPDGGC